MNRMLSILMLALLVGFGCRQSDQFSESQKAAVQVGIKHMLQQYSDSVASHDLLASLDFFHNSPDFHWSYKGSVFSYDSLSSRIKWASSQYTAVTIQWDIVSITPFTPDSASLVARYLEGTTSQNSSDTILGLVRANMIRVSGQWKFLNGVSE